MSNEKQSKTPPEAVHSPVLVGTQQNGAEIEKATRVPLPISLPSRRESAAIG